MRPVLIALCLSHLALGSLFAQAPDAGGDLSGRQLQVFRDYERFEKALFEVAEQMRLGDPDQAGLLYQARTQSQEQNILNEMTLIAELLRTQTPAGAPANPRYGPAVDRQAELLARMKNVLKLLQSLDDRERISAEIKRLEELLKDANRLIARQKDVRADTERGKPSEGLQQGERKLEEETGKLGQRIDEQDAQRRAEQEQRAPRGENQVPPQGQDPQPGANPPPQPPAQGNPPPAGDPQSPPSQQQQPDPNKTPGREQLEQARRAMQQALEQLQQNLPKEALENQEQAVNRLEEMKAELEKILRQLRQDERESYLTMLEARFQNMLKRQQGVNTLTSRLDKIPESDRAQQNYASQVDGLRKDQEDNALEAAKALRLLQDEGSSVAFPEAVEQMHRNMRLVVDRLSRQDTRVTTQTIEGLVQQTLEEMIAALRRELEESQQGNQPGRSGQSGGGGPDNGQGLVNRIAELKLIRSLQLQINVLTDSIGTELEGQPAAADPAQQGLLQDLSERQERLQKATYDLSTGRNR